MHLDFHNKVAVITGGARGIGAATAEFWIWTEMLAKSV
jgi:NAD(P)-dependent dehydrogenase (short-subunit alcohol dehydrogenase family)